MMKKNKGENINQKQKLVVKEIATRFLFFIYVAFSHLYFSQEIASSNEIKIIGGAKIIDYTTISKNYELEKVSQQRKNTPCKKGKFAKAPKQEVRIAKTKTSKIEKILKSKKNKPFTYFALLPISLKYDENCILNHTLNFTLNNSFSSKFFVKDRTLLFNFLFEEKIRVFFRTNNLLNLFQYKSKFYNRPPPNFLV